MRIVIAEDVVLFRDGLERIMTAAGFSVVGTVGSADDVLRLVADVAPEVALIDVRMPPSHTDDGLRAALAVRAQHPTVGVLMLSQYADSDLALTLLADGRGGVGYLLKDSVMNVTELTDAVWRVSEGGTVVDATLITRLLGRRRVRSPLDELTGRERSVLALMAEGRSNSAIAARLFLSERTVESHVSSIFGKLSLEDTADDHRRVLAVIAYLQH